MQVLVRLGRVEAAKSVGFILSSPRLVTTHIFDRRTTVYLSTMLLLMNAVQFILHLLTSFDNPRLDVYGSFADLVGIDFFSTISTRFAGFQIIDYRVINQGALMPGVSLVKPVFFLMVCSNSVCKKDWPSLRYLRVRSFGPMT